MFAILPAMPEPQAARNFVRTVISFRRPASALCGSRRRFCIPRRYPAISPLNAQSAVLQGFRGVCPHLFVYPPPVAPWPGGLRRIDEIHPKFGNARLFFDELLNLTFNLRDQAMRL